MSTVTGYDRLYIDIAETLGLSTEDLMSFTIRFEPDDLVTVEARYIARRDGLQKNVVNKLQKLRPV